MSFDSITDVLRHVKSAQSASRDLLFILLTCYFKARHLSTSILPLQNFAFMEENNYTNDNNNDDDAREYRTLITGQQVREEAFHVIKSCIITFMIMFIRVSNKQNTGRRLRLSDDLE